MIVQNLPLALVDLNQRKIVTNIFFSALYRKKKKAENGKVRGIFAVHFPSSEYFSDLWNSIPLLMHEASHTHNYGEIIERNKAVVFHIDQFFAEVIASKLLRIVNDGIMISASSVLPEILKERVYSVIRIQRKAVFEKIGDFENWKFQDLLVNCKEYYCSIFDKSVNVKRLTYNQAAKLKNKIQKDVEHIMQVVGFHEMCYAFMENVNSIPAVCYFINVLYLEFHSEFYEKYKDKYDSLFLEELRKESCSKEREVEEREILLLSLYRFLKYIKCDSVEITDSIKDIAYRQKDALAVAFAVVQLASMQAIFEKYRQRFQKEVSEEKYCDEILQDIISDSFTDFSNRLTAVYADYVKEQTDGKKPSMYDCSLMEAMFCEYYEMHLSINNVIRFFIMKPVQGERGADSFIESIHAECRKYICEEEEREGFKAIFTKSNREQLMKLGFFEKDSTVLKKVFARIFEGCEDKFVENIVHDRVELFKEVYADCGMCCAMGFDPFGYCMFALSAHETVNETSIVNETANFLADRVRAVIGMYFDSSEKEKWTGKLDEFLQKLYDIRMIMEICGMLLQIDDAVEVNEIHQRVQKDEYRIEAKNFDEAEIFQNNFKETLTRWRDDILGCLIHIIENKYEKEASNDVVKKDKVLVAKMYLFHVHNIMQLFAVEDILSHISNDMFDGFFQHVGKLMEEGKGIQAVKSDPCVIEISQYYNMDCPKDVENKFEWYYNIYSKGFITQCNFIFEHYCKYRNAYNNIKRNVNISEDGEVNLKINQWFEVIDEYYREGEA